MSNLRQIILGLIMLFMLGTGIKKTMDLIKERDAALALADSAAADAFQDCRRIMTMNEYMARVNTCYQVVTTMCSGQSKCVEHYQQMCATEDYE